MIMALKHIRVSTELLSAKSNILRRSTSGNIRQKSLIGSMYMIEDLLGELAVAGGTEVVTAAGEHLAEKIKTMILIAGIL